MDDLMADFNRVDKAGRIPVRILPEYPYALVSALKIGEHVFVNDGEGTRCEAVVEEYGHNGQYVLLRLIQGTVERQPV
jgi:hypothetical protein